MDALFTLFNRLGTLGLMIFGGYYIAKFKIIGPEFSKNIVDYLLKIAIPMMAIMALQIDSSKELFLSGSALFLLSSATYFVGLGIGVITARIFKVPYEKKSMWLYTSLITNTTFMGIPILQALYGERASFYCIVMNFSVSLFTYTVGLWIILKHSGSEKEKINIVKMLCTTLNISFLIGILLFVFGIHIPDTIGNAASFLASTVTPLGMIYIGMILASNTVKEMFGDIYAYLLTALRLILMPLFFFFLLRPLIQDKMFLCAVVLAGTGMPAPSMGALFIGKYGGDIKFASRVVFVTTLFSCVTIPALSFLFL